MDNRVVKISRISMEILKPVYSPSSLILYGKASMNSEQSKEVFQVQVFWVVTPCSVVVGY
jgi:hypothetical protein